jgi:hypothetical protein|tara:strand:- start:3802 stop:4044 length:243 start_codon:yes stop_codon:yes gene_type:complete
MNISLNTSKIVKEFGGMTKCCKALTQNGNPITLGAVDKWRRRNAMNLKSLLMLAVIAKENNKRFDLYDYIITEEMKRDEK